jgi:hypothetical protein
MAIPPIIAAAGLAAGAGLIGGGITSALNVHESRSNRRFQRDMSNTAMQRQMADMKKAGLNPLLAVQGAGGAHGASTPSGSAAHVDSPKIEAGLVGSAVMETQARTAKELAEVGKIKSETSFLNQSMEDRLNMTYAQLQHELKRKDLTSSEISHIEAQLVMMDQQYKMLGIQQEHSALDLDRMRAESTLYKTLGGWGAAGKAGLLRIPGGALFRARGARGAGKVFNRKNDKNWKRLNTKTGELRD